VTDVRATAAVLRSVEDDYSIEEIELPKIEAGQVLVRIVSAGICHTDSLLRTMASAPLPIIPGHEGAGVVEEVGAGITHVSAGDHVVLSYDYCGSCRNCRLAHTSYCDQFMARNFVGRSLDGSAGATDATGASVASRWFGQSSFATYAIATANNVVVVPQDADLTLLGPLGCGVQTGAGSVFNTLNVRPGSAFAVYGAGAVGLSALLAAVVAGATTIVAVDRHQHRLELALSLGATHVIDASDTDDVAGQVTAITGGGACAALDTTGVPEVVTAAIAGLRMTGICGLVGASSRNITLQASAIFGRHVVGIFEGDAVPHVLIPALVRLWQAGRFPFDRFVQTYDLADASAAEQASLRGEVVKPVLLPSPES
jgi:aryl-alcohol dehydrogenase